MCVSRQVRMKGRETGGERGCVWTDETMREKRKEKPGKRAASVSAAELPVALLRKKERERNGGLAQAS